MTLLVVAIARALLIVLGLTFLLVLGLVGCGAGLLVAGLTLLLVLSPEAKLSHENFVKNKMQYI